MWLVIGYGNRLRGDDGAGPVLAEKLAALLPKSQALVLSVHQLTPELVLEMLHPEIDRVLFIDVKQHQEQEFALSYLSAQNAAGNSCGHQLQPELLLSSAAKLYARSLPGWLLTLPGREFSFSEDLSPTTATAVSRALGKCLTFLKPPSNS